MRPPAVSRPGVALVKEVITFYESRRCAALAGNQAILYSIVNATQNGTRLRASDAFVEVRGEARVMEVKRLDRQRTELFHFVLLLLLLLLAAIGFLFLPKKIGKTGSLLV